MYSILPGFVIAALVQTIGQQVKDIMKLRTLGLLGNNEIYIVYPSKQKSFLCNVIVIITFMEGRGVQGSSAEGIIVIQVQHSAMLVTLAPGTACQSNCKKIYEQVPILKPVDSLN